MSVVQGLVALLAGGGEREVGTGREIELDASGSRDLNVDADQPQVCNRTLSADVSVPFTSCGFFSESSAPFHLQPSP